MVTPILDLPDGPRSLRQPPRTRLQSTRCRRELLQRRGGQLLRQDSGGTEDTEGVTPLTPPWLGSIDAASCPGSPFRGQSPRQISPTPDPSAHCKVRRQATSGCPGATWEVWFLQVGLADGRPGDGPGVRHLGQCRNPGVTCARPAEWPHTIVDQGTLDKTRTATQGDAMPEESRPYRHGIHEAMSVLAGKWVTAVLASLAASPMTYSELLDDINQTEERLGWTARKKPLSKKVLTETLDRMQRDGLLVKIDRPSRFGNTWYHLTDVGRALLRALRPLAKWADDHRRDVFAARSVHEAGRNNVIDAE